MGTKKKSKAAPKASKPNVRKIHIMKDWTDRDGDCYAFGKSAGRVMATGYASNYSAKRGAVRDLGGYVQREFDKKTGKYRTTGYFLQDGTPIQFINPAK